MSSGLADGHRVLVSQLGDDPMQAIADHTSLEPMLAPDAHTLAAHDVIVEIHSASVGWVDRKADPILSAVARSACELASGGSGSWSCRGVHQG